MKKIMMAVLVLGAAAGGVWYWMRNGGGATAETKPRTAEVARGPITVAVSATGRVVPNLDVEIKCKASGEIVKLPFDVSDPVKKGELLLELDPVDQQRVLKQAEVTLSASQAKLAIAKENLEIARRELETDRRRAETALKSAEAQSADMRAKADRVKKLIDKGLATPEAYDTAETAAIQAHADLENARIKLDELKTQEEALELKRQEVTLADAQVASDRIAHSVALDRLAETKVVAPIDGVVSARDVQIGQIISSAVSNVGGGTTVLTLSDLSHVYAIASVDESDIGKVQVGQPTAITADAFQGITFRGKVVRIAVKGVNVSNVVTFQVKIEVVGENKSLLKPEMTTNVEIISESKPDVLVVPAEAVTTREGRAFASVVGADGAVETRPIETGISDGVRTEVASGLSEGETVVVRSSTADSRWNAQRTGGPPPGMMMPPAGGGRR